MTALSAYDEACQHEQLISKIDYDRCKLCSLMYRHSKSMDGLWWKCPEARCEWAGFNVSTNTV